jgi:tRNA (guanine37-N1)-methyltransferase
MFAGPFAEGMVRKAIAEGRCDLRIHDLRAWGEGPHRVVDDYAFGGGPGMVLKAEPVLAAWEALERQGAGRPILLAPWGRRLDQGLCRWLAGLPGFTLLCGRYEGIDERVREALRPLELSIGDYVLSGGEPAAVVVVDAVVRLLPGVLAEGAAEDDSFATGLLEGPQYTRPRVLRGMAVPEVLLGGDHARIARWRRKEALRRTWRHRPDLLAGLRMSAEDARLLAEVVAEEARGGS